MKLSASLAALLLVDGAAAYAVAPLRAPTLPRRAPPPAALLGPEHVDAFASAPDALHAASMLVADKASQAADAQLAIDAAARGMTVEALKAETGDLGWWGTYIKTVEDGILGLRDTLQGMGVAFPYGISIFCFVLGVKLVTLPLNWNQLSGAANMKSIKPQQDLIRKWYGDNQQILNMEIGGLFENQKINPLAGCLPSLAQIPVFLGVYYSVTSIAKAQIFQEVRRRGGAQFFGRRAQFGAQFSDASSPRPQGFLWIPNLSGPIADRREGISWLTEGWVNGAPRFGWHDTLCYLTIPCILVCTQTAALYLLGSFDTLDESDESAQTALVALRLLPFMLGWFAMNAPAALGLYWVFNNVLTTASTVTVKKLVEKPPIDPKVDLIALGPRREIVPAPAGGGSLPEWGQSGNPTAQPETIVGDTRKGK